MRNHRPQSPEPLAVEAGGGCPESLGAKTTSPIRAPRAAVGAGLGDRLGRGWDAGSKGEERPETAAVFLLGSGWKGRKRERKSKTCSPFGIFSIL